MARLAERVTMLERWLEKQEKIDYLGKKVLELERKIEAVTEFLNVEFKDKVTVVKKR